MFKSIFSRLFWLYTVLLIMMFVTITAAAAVILDRYTMGKQRDMIMTVGEALEYWTGTYQVEQSDAQASEAYRKMLKAWSRYLRSEIVVSNLDGTIIGTTSTVYSIPSEYLEEIADGENIIRKGDFNGQFDVKQFTVGVPVRYNGNIVGGIFFNIPLEDITKTTVDIIAVFVLCGLFSFAAALILLYIEVKRISSPIGEINHAVRSIASGNFSERVRVTSGDEIGQLASSFNFMADSLEETENMQATFISDVSHELRTPMTSISGFAQSMLDGKIPPEKQDKYLQIIVDESHRLSKLVNDLLEMSKMSSSEYQLTIEKFDINELLRVCIISMMDTIESKKLELNVDFKAESLWVLGDKDSIQRVILNLMDNAVKFSFENTTIGISTWVKDKRAYISVGNFGIGIDNKDLSNVFTRFYKTDKSRRRNRTGAGLGLSLCKNIMTLHKQSIWVESNPVKEGTDTKYTKFTFTLETA